MPIHITLHRTCGRCGKMHDSRVLKYEDGLPKVESKPVELHRAGVLVFSFDDLCAKCDGVVNNLIERLTLDGPEKTDKSEKTAEGAEKGKSEPVQSEAGPNGEANPF